MNPFGVRTRDELLASGVSSSTIHDRCRSGRYTRLLPGIYCIVEPTPHAHCSAAVLWQPDAVLSHRTAAWLWNMLPAPTMIEASVPAGTSVRPPSWLKLYRREISAENVTSAWGLPTADPERAMLDSVAVLPRHEADAMVDDHIRTKVNARKLHLMCELDAGRVGVREQRRQLYAAAGWAASEPERIFGRALAARRCKLEPNHPVGTYFCDFVDERSRTIVEIDGREFHSEPEVFRKDRRRQNWLLLDGWLILRYAAYDVYQHLDEIADEAVRVVRKRRRTRR
ncbi:type IV toxin-antitoxin system AbiEi family antitoxin domain-containing protein [Rhodococcus spelaei]|nr:type IV toxin-antitoxin system AbiEi family antitoxin domain-containing protein [Rhodococcus spelaei]